MASKAANGLLPASATAVVHIRSVKMANVQEVPEQWTEILQWIAAGEEVQVTSQGHPVARLTPWSGAASFIGATVGGPALPKDLDEPTGEKW